MKESELTLLKVLFWVVMLLGMWTLWMWLWKAGVAI